MEILIIQTAFIGDIALSVFFANEIKQILPDAKITFISTKIGCQILRCFDFIDNPVCFDKRNTHKGIKGLKKIITEINTDKKNNTIRNFDFIFALHRSFRTGLLFSKINAKNKIGFNTNELSFLLTKKIKYQKNIHEVLRNRKMLSVLPNFNQDFNYKKLVEKNISSFKFIVTDNTDGNFFKHIDDTDDKFSKPILIAPGSV
jgi:heptosyltransferase-2